MASAMKERNIFKRFNVFKKRKNPEAEDVGDIAVTMTEAEQKEDAVIGEHIHNLAERIFKLEQAFGDKARRVEYSTKMPSKQELLGGNTVTNVTDNAEHIIKQHRWAQKDQPDQKAFSVINLNVATKTSYNFFYESKKFKSQQDALRKALGRDYDKEENRPTLNAILAMLGNWKDKSTEERQEFIKQATDGERSDHVWFFAKEKDLEGLGDVLAVFIRSKDGFAEIFTPGVAYENDHGGVLVSGPEEIFEVSNVAS